jgi:tyrosyl-tRNA synthetase
LAQLTDPEEIKELINAGKATFYIGFDPTADSLHVGHFMALLLMKRLQEAGNKPVALVGGGTGMIGDPSGRTDLRSMMTVEQIDHNCECFKKQMSRFIEFGEGKAMMVNNADWLRDLNYIEFLRDIGSCFSVNEMLRARCYEQRMEKGLSFLEFNYMIMQAFDFYNLYRTYGCNMQFGGDDQWSNMLAGTELIRKTRQGRFRHDHHPSAQLRGQEDGQNSEGRSLARSRQDFSLRFLPVLEKYRRRGRP